jgi:precorrin-6Y C5,15-methyltransferase (decarboxylating)
MADDAATQAPWLTIIGIGDNGLESLTPPARLLFDAAAHHHRARARARPDRLRGARNHSPGPSASRQTIALVMARRGTPVTILATGDPMHFGIGATLMRDLDASEMRVIPSPSAFSLAASTARLGAAGCGA